MELTDLFYVETILKDVNSLDKSLMEKMALDELLDTKEKPSSTRCSMLLLIRKIKKEGVTTS